MIGDPDTIARRREFREEVERLARELRARLDAEQGPRCTRTDCPHREDACAAPPSNVIPFRGKDTK